MYRTTTSSPPAAAATRSFNEAPINQSGIGRGNDEERKGTTKACSFNEAATDWSRKYNINNRHSRPLSVLQ